MKKFKNNKGFTLMEMLIVVAIIAILVAIAIPSFTTQLEKAREAADIANIRSAYAEAMANYLSGDLTAAAGETAKTQAVATTPAMTQTQEGWKYVEWPEYLGKTDAGKPQVEPTKGQIVTVTISDDQTNGGLQVKITAAK